MAETKRLCIFVALVLGVPALINQAIPVKAHFDSAPIAELRATNPDLVLIGDSMLDSRIDAPLLEEKLGGGQRVAIVWNGGAASACWYLFLKNYVAASGVRPRMVCIFFRDRLLTDASFRTGGIFRSFLESIRHQDDPVVRRVLGNELGGAGAMERWVTQIYPLNGRRQVQQEKIGHMMFRVATPNARAAKKLEREVNKTFDVAKMRGEVMAESTDVSKAVAQPFDPSPDKSFLPHMVETAARAHLPLCFVRVKRHPQADGRVPQSDALRQYIRDLSAWLESRGCAFIDDTNDSAFRPEMYLKAKDDHIGPWAKKQTTEIYAEKLRPLLAP